MTQKTNAQPRNAELSARKNSANPTITTAMTPRQERVIHALSNTAGWLWREQIDRIAGASNGPEVIRQLRCKLTGYEGIDMEQVSVTDRDGRHAKPGRYRLTDLGRQRLAEKGVA
ncbi:hypothetical protein [Comamonas thiooxydans]|uniref:hypothetical protein n=1 Tax=Comamonas thiooxydans TaxID=363952 RepID=UPI0001BB174A|nr:hypothetical protein [Comamonas thiooxydans]ACY33750.1 conserved hypothetical protein [Comamonas thiooxydans]MDO1474026.1 hypothetical protein [Comamonas thiooxydans]